MSMACCDDCGQFIDCDDDPDACDFKPNKFICEACREQDRKERAIDKAMYDAEEQQP